MSDTFIRMGIKHNINPAMIICIAQADSSLGKALKSSNNLGNVGNNDRGGIIHYPTLEHGIEAIANVLNNKYLGQHQTLGDLSRGGGNLNGYIYASSKYNWNKNVKYCLRDILQDNTINESYRFRIQFNKTNE